jgi:hypothetical protein
MKTVTILANFDGYPHGKKRSFVAGEKPELPDAYADLLVGKGLAAKSARAKPSTAAAETADGQPERKT